MKKHSSLFLFLISFILPLGLLAQEREVRNVDSFTKISFSVAGELYLSQGSPQRVELGGDPDDLKEVETSVQGGRLRISRESGWFDWGSDNRDIKVFITVPNLEALSVSGSGEVIGEGQFRTDDLDLDVSGSGSLSLDVNASGDVEADVSGSGNVFVKGRFDEFESDVSGSGEVEVEADIRGVADFGISGSGKIVARGKAEAVKTSISGSGKVLAADLEAERCDVVVSGSGDVEVNVKDELNASIGGSGSVSYRGDPKKVNSNSSGSGKVRKM